MANTTANFTLKLNTEGMNTAEKQSQAIRNNLEAAAKAGGSVGSRKASQSSAASPTGAAGMIAGQQVENYNRLRGSAGAAGGTARDFADQARGLGGLVRLYATFAANIFAATAALSALKNAADTTNLVKGLDQLGASAGRNLGTLSKRLMEASDGAISLRDAMEATVKGASAGLTNKQLLEMGDAAKKASQALGLSMPDALNRLSRGISKLEPELLDELGIYVKIEDAVTNYARSLGKTSTSLTDFERRQAFAVAVLDQANKKFSSIEIDANPYSKLLATFQNLVQSGLEVVNKVFGPLVNLLAESPVALATIIGAIGLSLVKTAIPAITRWREGIRQSADEAAAAAKRISDSFGDRFQDKLESIFNLPKLKEAVTKTEEELNRLKSKAVVAPTLTPELQARFEKSGKTALEDTFSQKTINTIDSLIEKRKEYTDTASKGNTKLSDEQVRLYKQELQYLQQKRDFLIYNNSISQKEAELLRRKVEAQEAFNRAQAKADKPIGRFDPESLALRETERLLGRQQRFKAVGAAADTASILGVREAWAELNKTVNEKDGFKGVNKYLTLIQGGFAAVGTRLLGLLNPLTNLVSVVGGLVFAFQTLDSWFSSNSEQTDKFKAELETAAASVKLVNDTIETASKRGLETLFNPKTIEARSTALTELSQSVKAVGQSFESLVKASNIWDNIIDSIAQSVGRGRLDKLSKSLSTQIEAAFKALPLGATRNELEKQLKEVLKIDNLDASSISSAIKKAGDEGGIQLANSISNAITQASNKSSEISNKLKDALSGFDQINKSYQDLAVSLKDSTPISQFASNMAEGLIKASQGLEDTNNSIAIFNRISSDINILKLFSPESIEAIKNTSSSIKQASREIENYEIDVRKGEQAQKDLSQFMSRLSPQQLLSLESYKKSGVKTFVDDLNELIKKGKDAKVSIDVKVEEVGKTLNKILTSELNKTANLIAQEFSRSVQKASLDYTNTVINKLGNGVGKAEAEFQIQKERILLEQQSISAMYELTRAIENNSLTIRKADTGKKIEEERLSRRVLYDGNNTELERLQKELEDINQATEFVNKGLKITVGDFEKLSQAAPNVAKSLVGFFQATMGVRNKLVATSSQLRIAELTKELNISSEQFESSQKRSREELNRLKNTQQIAALLSSIYGLENESFVIAKQAADTAVITKEQKITENELQNKINIATEAEAKLKNQISKEGATEARKASLQFATNTRIEASRELEVLKEQNKELNRQRELRDKIELISSQTQSKQKELEIQNSIRSAAEDLFVLNVNSNKTELDFLTDMGFLSEKTIANRVAGIARETQAIQYQRAIREAQYQKEQQDIIALDKARKAMAIAGADEDAQNKAMAQLLKDFAEADRRYKDRIVSAQVNNDLTLKGIGLDEQKAARIAETNELLEQQKQKMSQMESITESLAALFGEFGSSVAVFAKNFGKFGETLLENKNRQESYNRELKKFDDRLKNIDDMGEFITPEVAQEYNDILKNRAKLVTQNAEQEVKGNIKAVASAKVMFKEKTFAYKALSGLEKTLHVMKLANDAIQTASALKNMAMQTASTIGGTLKMVPAYATDIYGKTIGQLGPILGPAVAAGLLATLFSFIGGGSAPPPKGFTAEEQQQIQGTGNVYRDGKVVATGAGILGDSTAKSNSIANAISNMEKYDFKNLEYNNKMLGALLAIEKNTQAFTTSLLKSIPDINIKPETIKSGNWFFGKETVEVLDQGITVIGNVGQIIDKTAQLFKYTNTKISSSGFLGFLGGSTSYNTDQKQLRDTALSNELSLIFSSVGKALGTAAETLGMGTASGVLEGFRAIDLSEQFKRISLMDLKPEEMAKEIGSVISAALDTAALQLLPSLGKFQKAGESFGDTVLRVANNLKSVQLSFEEMGLALPKLVETGARPTQEQLNRLTAAQLRYNAALAANNAETLVWVEENAYNNTGSLQLIKGTAESLQELTEATAELTSAQDAVNAASSSLTTKTLDLVDAYIEAAGGLEKFIEKNRFFAENFLTDAERLAPVQKRVVEELDRLNLGMVNTREGFKLAVIAAQTLGESGVQLYTDLMNLAPAFDEVMRGQEDLQNRLKDSLNETIKYIDTIFGMVDQALRLRGALDKAGTDLMDAQYIQRVIKLQDLEQQYQYLINPDLTKEENDQKKIENDIRKNNIIGLQKYIWALEDEVSARDKYLDSIKNFSSVIQREISTMEKNVSYIDNVLGFFTQAINLGSTALTTLTSKEIERTIAIQNLTKEYSGPENEARLKSVTSLQKYVWALQDEKDAKDKYVAALQTQVQAIQNEIGNLEKSIQDYDKFLDQRATIAELLSDSTMSTQIRRERELASIRKSATSEMADALVANQEYIYALEDEKSIKDQLLEQREKERESITNTIDTIKESIKALEDFKKELLLSSDLTVLTPEDQYKEARRQFEETLARTKTIGLDEAGRRAQQEAVAALPQASQKFLELSRTMFASSGNYITDFKLVKQSINDTTDFLGEQLSDAEKQLKELEQSTSFLNEISTYTKTTSELLADYTAAQSRTQAAAEKAGGLTTEEVLNLRQTAEEKISALQSELESVNKMLEEVLGKTLTLEEARQASDDARLSWEQATSTALLALTEAQTYAPSAEDLIQAREREITQIVILTRQLRSLEEIQKAIAGTPDMSYQDAQAAAATALENYTAAQTVSDAAYSAIGSSINAGTISQALTIRGSTLEQLRLLNEQVVELRDIKAIAYGNYRSTLAEQNNEVQPREVNVGATVTGTLTTLTETTAKVVDAVQEVKVAVTSGDLVTIQSNTSAVQQQTQEFINAIQTAFSTSNWAGRSAPVYVTINETGRFVPIID